MVAHSHAITVLVDSCQREITFYKTFILSTSCLNSRYIEWYVWRLSVSTKLPNAGWPYYHCLPTGKHPRDLMRNLQLRGDEYSTIGLKSKLSVLDATQCLHSTMMRMKMIIVSTIIIIIIIITVIIIFVCMIKYEVFGKATYSQYASSDGLNQSR